MLLAKQCVLVGPRSRLSAAVTERMQVLGIRALESDSESRADSLLRTARRLALLIVDVRTTPMSPDLMTVARAQDPTVPILWVKTATAETPTFAGKPPIVVSLDPDADDTKLIATIDAQLQTTLFPDALLSLITEATTSTFDEQYHVQLALKTTMLRGDAEALAEVGIGASFTSEKLVAYLGIFASRSFLEMTHRQALHVDANADEIARELTNLIAGRLRGLLLSRIPDLRFRLPAPWDTMVSVRNAVPALVMSFERGGRLDVDFRIARFDSGILTSDSSAKVLAPGSMSFLE